MIVTLRMPYFVSVQVKVQYSKNASPLMDNHPMYIVRVIVAWRHIMQVGAFRTSAVIN